MRVGLRIDVDTYRGTRMGVPNLTRLLDTRAIRASFFFSVGPDNMGRHVWRLLRPAFVRKMLRSNAPSLYGWDILLRGTFWPGPVIGDKLGHVIRAASDAGHEVGYHAWDHHAWQMRIDRMSREAVRRSLTHGMSMLREILGRMPDCSAAPAWRTTDAVGLEKARFPFRYNSDCRGHSIFRPVVGGRVLDQPQVPTTLPTYDEVIGQGGVTHESYNEFLLSLLSPEKLNVLTIHAEAEGIACLVLFEDFVEKASLRGVTFVPLGDLLADSGPMEQAAMVPREIPGRDGWVSCQTSIHPPGRPEESLR